MKLGLKKINLCNQYTKKCKECTNFNSCINFANFFEKHKETASYAHFDYRTSLANPKTRKYIMNPEKVKKHGFYPFVNFTKKETKYSKEIPDHIKYKERELYYAAHLDRCIYQYYAHLINTAYNEYSKEKNLDNVAIAYRNNSSKTNIHCAKEAFEFLKTKQEALIIINDFTSFFDKLDHEYLKKMMNKILKTETLPDDYHAIWKNITKFSWLEWEDIVKGAGLTLETGKLKTKLNSQSKLLERHEFRKIQKYINKNTKSYGIPQGSPISAVLANIYMAEFDDEMNNFITKHQGIYKRYSDDTIVIIPIQKKEEINYLIENYNKIIQKYSNYVTIKPEKTEIATYQNNQIQQLNSKAKFIDYLGFRFRDGKIYMRPRSITRYFYRLKRQAKRIFNDCNTPTHISYKDIYTKFSDCYVSDNSYGNFISYAKKADKILNLEQDTALQKILKYNKMYIRKAINKYSTIIRKA